ERPLELGEAKKANDQNAELQDATSRCLDEQTTGENLDAEVGASDHDQEKDFMCIPLTAHGTSVLRGQQNS
ncbi:unnamed protein product, partial [Amoebophrya sp. A25]